MSEEEIGPFHAHEALDRMFLINDMFDYYIFEHPYIKQNLKLSAQAEKLSTELYLMYNEISNVYFDQFPNEWKKDENTTQE